MLPRPTSRQLPVLRRLRISNTPMAFLNAALFSATVGGDGTSRWFSSASSG